MPDSLGEAIKASDKMNQRAITQIHLLAGSLADWGVVLPPRRKLIQI